MAGRLLVVAKDEDLRRSLAFSLGAHGYSVVARSAADIVDADERFDCTIIDEEAARPLGDFAAEFYRRHAPIVLLHYDSVPADVAFALQKPLNGDDIVKAVAALLAHVATTK